MKILLLSDDPAFELPCSRSGKSAPVLPLSALDRDEVAAADIVYLDPAGFSPAALSRYLTRLSARRAGGAWGLADASGSLGDPAAAFHAGAADYLGPAGLGLCAEPARQKRVIAHAAAAAPAKDAPPSAPAELVAEGGAAKGAGASGRRREDQDAFPGWGKLKEGQEREFHFLYAAIAEPGSVKSGVGESGWTALQARFRDFMGSRLAQAEALLWMSTETSLLYLLPPAKEAGAAALEACLGILLNRPLVITEGLSMGLALDFVLAMHRGRTVYRSPGRTGTLVSEDLNFIFHLGSKRAEADRLTLSRELENSIAPEFADIFVPAGSFEGHQILHSRRFLRGPSCRI